MRLQFSLHPALAAAAALALCNGEVVMAQRPAVTPYGELRTDAPEELRLFSFLIGTWDGKGRTRLPNGEFAEYELTWIGRYILDGRAILDELRTPDPDGRIHLGITIRYFDQAAKGWIIEFINTTGSFIRRQVNASSGALEIDGDTLIVVSEDGEVISREYYTPIGDTRFTYSIDLSSDGGKTWNRGSLQWQFDRSEESPD